MVYFGGNIKKRELCPVVWNLKEMARSEGGNTNDPTARRRKIAERGSDRLALITAGRAPNTSNHSSNASCPPSPDQILPSADENRAETPNKGQTILRKSESSRESVSKPDESQSSPKKSTQTKKIPKSDLQIYLYKTVSPNQLCPAILSSQDTRRKCSFFAGIVAVLSCVGFPIIGSYIVRSIMLSRPLLLLLLINVTITVGPLLLDAMKMIQHEANAGSSTSDADIPDTLGSPFEWGMLFKTGLSAFFMDSCIYSVVVVYGMSLLQKFGL